MDPLVIVMMLKRPFKRHLPSPHASHRPAPAAACSCVAQAQLWQMSTPMSWVGVHQISTDTIIESIIILFYNILLYIIILYIYIII